MEGIADQAPGAGHPERRRRDRLTGLLSRLAFEQRVAEAEDQAREAGGEVAIVFLDLVDFRAVNQRYGTEGGDAVLRAVAGRLRQAVRDIDHVARVGGDEFAVLLTDARGSGLQAASERIGRIFQQPFTAAGHLVGVVPRMTVTVGPSGQAHAEDLLWRSIKADAAAANREMRDRLSEAERRCRRDPLTGALNRFGLEEAAAAMAPPYGLALVDIDGLKQLNDTAHGYQAGDRALCLVAGLLGRGREGDVVGRWGGDEFVLLLPGATAASTATHLERLLAAVGQTRHDQVMVTFSAGVAEVRRAGGFAGALASADRAVHAAKRAGRARVLASS